MVFGKQKVVSMGGRETVGGRGLGREREGESVPNHLSLSRRGIEVYR